MSKKAKAILFWVAPVPMLFVAWLMTANNRWIVDVNSRGVPLDLQPLANAALISYVREGSGFLLVCWILASGWMAFWLRRGASKNSIKNGSAGPPASC